MQNLKSFCLRYPLISLSPSGRRISTSAEELHPLNPLALLATILNDVLIFGVGGAFLELHCLFAYDAVQETFEGLISSFA